MSIDRNHIEMNAVPAWHASAHGLVSAGAAGMAISKPKAAIRTRCAFTGFQVVDLTRDGRHKRRGAWRGGV